jgi:phosphate transport system substrate-binding protein
MTNVLVQGISHDKYALGYFGYAYYAENKFLKAVAIVPDGEVLPWPTLFCPPGRRY